MLPKCLSNRPNYDCPSTGINTANKTKAELIDECHLMEWVAELRYAEKIFITLVIHLDFWKSVPIGYHKQLIADQNIERVNYCTKILHGIWTTLLYPSYSPDSIPGKKHQADVTMETSKNSSQLLNQKPVYWVSRSWHTLTYQKVDSAYHQERERLCWEIGNWSADAKLWYEVK